MGKPGAELELGELLVRALSPDGVPAVVPHVVGGDQHADDGEVLVMQVCRHPVQEHGGPAQQGGEDPMTRAVRGEGREG